MQMKKLRLALLTVLIGSMAACSTSRHSAPIVERAASGSKTTETGRSTAAKAAPKPVADSHGFYTVRKGDTLLHIALEFGQNYRDIITWNHLSDPDDIKVDQVLRVLPPETGAGAAQIGGVATPSSVEVRPLGGQTVQNAAPNKTTPRGDKRIYSDAALAEMRKPDVPAVAPKVVESKVVGRESGASRVTNTDDEIVSWIWPAEGKVIGTFDDGKKGIDIAGRSGQQVVAAGSGKVMYAGSGIRGYGNLVIVKHTNSLLSAYAHNKTILVKEGQTVTKGQKIAEMGSSDTDAVKLHFEIRQQGKPVDPSKFLPNR
jgi:lipoprotein NlpD